MQSPIRRLRNWFVFSCYVLICLFMNMRPAFGQVNAQFDSQPSEIGTDTDHLLQEIDTYSEKVRKDWNVPGLAVAIVQDDQVVFAKGYGTREFEQQEPVDGDTQFAIASNTKAFTAACLAILVDAGQVGWDDPVSNYLPEFQMSDAFVTRELTVRDLVCHRSGLKTFSGDLLWFETDYSPEEVLRRVRYLQPTSSFRSRYGYQNLMFLAAGEVIQCASGQAWDEFVRAAFFARWE